MHPQRTVPLILSLVALLPLAACDMLGIGSDDETLSVSFSVPRTSLAGRSAALIPITDGLHTIDLLNVDLTIDRIVIEREGRDMDDEGDDGGNGGRHSRHHDEGTELRAGAVTVALPLTGGVVTLINSPLPEGTYDEIKFKVSFVRARGTFDGQPFDLTLAVNVGLDLDLDPPFVVDSADDSFNVTITVDPTTWFKINAIVIDPRAVQLNAMLRRALENQIRASFRAFEDSDRDADDRDTDTDKHDRRGSNHGHG
ncbi:MAG: hypothetical protein ACRENP_08425 [Longimicrobiales bacterium]